MEGNAMEFDKANSGLRAAAYLIDVIPAIFIGLFGLIPLIGVMIVGCLLTPYWLLRDVTGASLGKMLLGLKVVSTDGGQATTSARILRNVPLVAGPVLMIIPLLGYVLGPPVAALVILVEVVLLLTQGDRLGDKLAGTTVASTRK
jgi:uncharacterized RDD family membrane protein YckC